jgi:hypothetical protein
MAHAQAIVLILNFMVSDVNVLLLTFGR